MTEFILHDYWRSSAGFRVRIALNLKQISYDRKTYDLRLGKQKAPTFMEVAPQGLVPALQLGTVALTQSLAIMEWLEETHPANPLLPQDANERAIVRAMADVIACDIHPLNNLRVIQSLTKDFDITEAQKAAWISLWIREGFAALEKLVDLHGDSFSFGGSPTIADCCLIPQLYSARRFEVDVRAFPNLRRIEDNAMQLQAFQNAVPENQTDSDCQ